MEDHWHRIRELVAVMVALLYGQDDNGMELYFTSSAKKFGPFTEPYQFVEKINEMRPNRPRRNLPKHGDMGQEIENSDDIREVLFDILNLVGKGMYRRKLTLIIFTDGVWKDINDKRTVAHGIANRLQIWEDKPALKQMVEARDISLQFVQFGDDWQATEEFKYLDNDLTKPDGTPLPDIIDVEHASGNIKKMILGSLSDVWDGPPRSPIASDDTLSRHGQADYVGTGIGSGTLSSPTQYPSRPSPHRSVNSGDFAQINQHPDYNPSRDILMSGAQFNPASPTSSRPTQSLGSPYTPSPSERGVQSQNCRSRGTSQYNSYHDQPDS
ncbi:hypothetical protein B0J14DRAFT_311898 [Halenospora varia]|nr:hypothetical protein B0J14DRAFT_311898 [Halenospora varia]